MDAALRIEQRYFTHILQTKEAAAMIRSLFVSMQELNKGARRPQNVPPTKLKKLGIIGAGFMGAGIAYVTARAGMDVVLIDRDMEAADKGQGASRGMMEQIAKGRAKEKTRQAAVAEITPTADYADLKPAAISSSRRCSRIAPSRPRSTRR
jgi:3-hydroxyacyl-CoA dehydrogenase/enoyl-CoA hydratase/3-hydroxybutyryl-CoA epimerase